MIEKEKCIFDDAANENKQPDEILFNWFKTEKSVRKAIGEVRDTLPAKWGYISIKLNRMTSWVEWWWKGSRLELSAEEC